MTELVPAAANCAIALALVVALAGCKKERTISDADAERMLSSIKSEAFQNRISRLENNATRDYAPFRRGEAGWSWLTKGALSVRVKAEMIGPMDGGTLVRIGMANPLALPLSECWVRIQWAEVGTDKMAIRSTWRSVIHRIPGPIASGQTFTQDLTLPGIPYDKLGIVTLGDLYCLYVGDAR